MFIYLYCLHSSTQLVFNSVFTQASSPLQVKYADGELERLGLYIAFTKLSLYIARIYFDLCPFLHSFSYVQCSVFKVHLLTVLPYFSVNRA